MFEKLKNHFRVKERQDFRTLYTEPPVSFAEEYPQVPKPESALSPQLLAARWATHDLYGEDMPAIAADLLELGFDSPALRRLAAESLVECSEDIEGLVSAMFRDLCSPYPIPEDEANLIFSRQVAREVIAGQRNAWAAASHITIVLQGRHSDDPELRAIAELLNQLNWDSVNRDRLPQMTSELIEAFARLGEQTKREQRVAALGSLEGKGWIANDFDAPLPDDLRALFEGRDEPPDKWR